MNENPPAYKERQGEAIASLVSIDLVCPPNAPSFIAIKSTQTEETLFTLPPPSKGSSGKLLTPTPVKNQLNQSDICIISGSHMAITFNFPPAFNKENKMLPTFKPNSLVYYTNSTMWSLVDECKPNIKTFQCSNRQSGNLLAVLRVNCLNSLSWKSEGAVRKTSKSLATLEMINGVDDKLVSTGIALVLFFGEIEKELRKAGVKVSGAMKTGFVIGAIGAILGSKD